MISSLDNLLTGRGFLCTNRCVYTPIKTTTMPFRCVAAGTCTNLVGSRRDQNLFHSAVIACIMRSTCRGPAPGHMQVAGNWIGCHSLLRISAFRWPGDFLSHKHRSRTNGHIYRQNPQVKPWWVSFLIPQVDRVTVWHNVEISLWGSSYTWGWRCWLCQYLGQKEHTNKNSNEEEFFPLFYTLVELGTWQVTI